MTFTQRIIDKWFSKFEQYIFKYKDGFFELPFVANSPEVQVQSFDKMPFVKHFKKEQKVYTNNPFMKVTLDYRKLEEEGLWFFYASGEYKRNVNYRKLYNKELPSDYYILSMEISTIEEKVKPVLINGLSYSYRSWLLFKPGANTASCHFKGSKELSFAVFFNETWLQNVLYKDQRFFDSGIQQFFESEDQYIIWPDTEESTAPVYKPIKSIFDRKEEPGKENSEEIKIQMWNLISRFLIKYRDEDIRTHYFEINPNDRKRIMLAERIIIKNLFTSFQGIEGIAREVGISETTLKANFKLMYGQSIFQYFRQKQMESARVLLENGTYTVKEIAYRFGYENASKFSAAFKKQFEVLPSELLAILKEEE